MDTVFPFGFGWTTALYLTLYVFTWIIHFIFMNYVLAGTGYLAVASLLGGRNWSKDTIARVLRDWMPFALGATITAGIAPLLFVQVLYQKAFYTANLLLFNRWMSILPVLIVAFYLLYLQKTWRVGNGRLGAQRAVALAAFLCVAFTGYSWAENHTLSLESGTWVQFYMSQPLVYHNIAIVPRFATVAFCALATMSLLIMWQLRFYEQRTPPGQERIDVLPRHVRRLAALAIVGLVGAVGAAIVYWMVVDSAKQAAVTSPLVFPYLLVGGAGLLIEIVGWSTQLRRDKPEAKNLVIITVGLLLAAVALAVVREGIRIHSVDMQALSARHAKAAAVGGFGAFVFFLLINAGLIALSLRQVTRGAKPEPNS